MKIFYTDHFILPLPPGHRSPMGKYSLLRERVKAARLVPSHEFLVPDAATDTEILRVHHASYLDARMKGMLDAYSEDVEDTIEIHFRSVAAAAHAWRGEPEATSR